MKKDSEEKNILKHQKRRRNKKIRLGVSSVLLIIIAIIYEKNVFGKVGR